LLCHISWQSADSLILVPIEFLTNDPQAKNGSATAPTIPLGPHSRKRSNCVAISRLGAMQDSNNPRESEIFAKHPCVTNRRLGDIVLVSEKGGVKFPICNDWLDALGLRVLRRSPGAGLTS
jgi:hypothetical protein